MRGLAPMKINIPWDRRLRNKTPRIYNLSISPVEVVQVIKDLGNKVIGLRRLRFQQVRGIARNIVAFIMITITTPTSA